MSSAFSDINDEDESDDESSDNLIINNAVDEQRSGSSHRNGSAIQNRKVEQKLRSMDVGSDPALDPDEKETSLTFPNDTDHGTFYTEVPTMIKWVLSIEGSDIVDFREVDDVGLVAIKATIPKGYFKFQKSARKSMSHSQMVSYGGERE